MIFVGQTLKLPYIEYKVVAGDSLSLIAKKYGTTVQLIRSYNQLQSDVIRVGQLVRIPIEVNPQLEPTEPIPTKPPESTSTYTVVSGDSLSIIAREFNTTVSVIQEKNGLTSTMIHVGQRLIIPTAADTQPVPMPVPTPEPEQPKEKEIISYIVQPGDSLSVIAKKFDTTVATIKTENNLTSDIIFVSQKLSIPRLQPVNEEEQKPIEETPQPVPEKTIPYTVVSGDSLSVIARNFETTVQAIKAQNNLQTDVIRVGQTLIIPTKEQAPVVEKPSSPQFSFVDPINKANELMYELTGRGEIGSKVTVTLVDEANRKITEEVEIGADGQFFKKINVESLKDGNITLSAIAIKNGKQSETRSVQIIKDTEIFSPEATLMPFINIESEKRFVISGQVKSLSKVIINAIDETGKSVSTDVVAKADGKFLTDIDLSGLKDGQVEVKIVQRDSVGNKSEESVYRVEKDTSKPSSPTLQSETQINNQNEAEFPFKGVAESGAEIVLTITDKVGQTVEGTAKANNEGQFQTNVDVSSLRDGVLVITVEQTDRAGNKSDIERLEMEKDTVKPIVEITSSEVIFSGNENEYRLLGHAKPNSVVFLSVTDGKNTIQREGKTDESGAYLIELDLRTLEDGKVSFTIFSKDSRGNLGEKEEITVIKDTMAPQPVSVSALPYVNAKNQFTYKISGTSEESGVNLSIFATDGNKSLSKEVTVETGVFESEFDFSVFEDGGIEITFISSDKYGNTSEQNVVNVEKITTVNEPTIARSGFVMEGGTLYYNVTGVADPYTTITVTVTDESDRGPITITYTVDGSGIFNIDVNVTELNVTRPLHVTVSKQDQAANESETVIANANIYTVVSGDSLSVIAKRFNTTVEGIRTINHLTNDNIFVGQQLRMPLSASDSINLGYVYFGDPKGFTNQVLRTNRTMNTVSPSYFDINPNGTLKLTYQVDPNFVSNMQNQGIRVVPFLSNHWDRELGRSMLANREQAANEIRDAVMKYNLNGINIDLENITHVDRDAFTDFVRLVREKLPSSKEVSVAVAANPNGWTAGWHGAYDYKNLSKYVDYLMIMTYDESFPGSEPGPVASKSFVERSVQYALGQGVPNDKIVIGLAHYGRYWIEGRAQGGNGLSTSQINQMLGLYESKVEFDEKTQSAKATVTIKENDPKTFVLGSALPTGTYTIWFENEQSYKAKASLVETYGLKGLGHWSIGQEDTSIWNSYPLWKANGVTTPVSGTVGSGNATPTAPVEQNEITYIVKSGDSLYKIAQQYNTTVNAIKQLNNLTSDIIFVGQNLKIPK